MQIGTMIRLLLLAASVGLTVNLPLPDAKIYFPDESIPIDPRSAHPHYPSQVGQRTHYTKTSSYRKSGEYQSPIQWPTPGDGSEHQYGTLGHHTSYSSYGHHPHHLSYSSHSYGTGESGHAPAVHAYESHSHSYGGRHSSGSVGQTEQVSHGGSQSQSGPQHEVHNWQEAGNHASHGQSQRVVQEESHVQQSGYGGQHREEQIEQTSDTRHIGHSRSPAAESSYGQHMEGHIQQVSDTSHVGDSRGPVAESSYGLHSAGNGQETTNVVKKPSAADIAAEEHHIIQEIEELAGITSSPEGHTKNPITQQQEIIREIKGLADPNRERNNGNADAREESAVQTGSSQVNHELDHSINHHELEDEHGKVHREEVAESPSVKEISDQGSLGVHHGSMGASRHVIHTEAREETSHSGPHKKSTPDPLDLMNIYNDFVKGDFKPGHAKEPVQEPKKELKPEIKEAIDNIMRDWEVLPDSEGKPQPPPRNYKVTKHVKVTTTTHNHPVVHPSQTITKTVKTHTFHPSSSHHQTTHHINIAELLEQLRQLESSPNHRNVTWCEEKIKEFLTELNRKEESGIVINQSVQEETLHHILTQDQTITKETHHVIGHGSSGGVEEEPFVKKTVVELGLNEPTRPPSHWTEQETKHETYSSTGEEHEEGPDVDGKKENEPHEIDYGRGEVNAEFPREPEEPHMITVTPSPHHIPPLESLSHQTHTSSETVQQEENEIMQHGVNSENDGVMEPNGSEPESVTTAPVQPTPDRPNQSDLAEFQGDVVKHDRPLPPSYKPRDRSEEANESENREYEKGNGVETNEHNSIDDLSIDLPENEFNHDESNEHKSIENPNIDLPQYEQNASSNVKSFIEKEQAAGEEPHYSNGHSATEEAEIEQTGHYGGHDIMNEDEKKEGSYNHQEGEHVHEVNTTEHSGGGSQTEYTEETVEHHKSGGSHGHGGGANTDYLEETVHHSSEGKHGHSAGGSQTEYIEETVEHHNSEGSHEINYDQLIEELISLESLPGHQAIDKCEEKIRHFLEVLKRQQERGFDENKVELERLRHLIEEMQAQKQNQIANGVNPHNPEASTSFWRKIGRKIKSTFEKAKTKAHDTVNGMMKSD